MNEKKGPTAPLNRQLLLEENRQFTQNALEMVLSLGDFQKEINDQVTHETIFVEAESRIRKLIAFDTTAFYSIHPKSSDLLFAVCHPSDHKNKVEEQVEFLIEKGFIAWALRERRGVTIFSKDHKQQIFIHVIATYSRVRGLFIGIFPETRQSVADVSYELLSIILRSTANAIESIEHYDLTKEQADSLKASNRALRLHSKCNKVIVHAKNESELIDQVCQTIVEEGEYRFAWIGLAGQGKGKPINPVAYHGVEEGYLDGLDISWENPGKNPAGIAVHERNTVICRKISSDPRLTSHWKKKAEHRGYRSCIALPLIHESQTFGVLAIYASKTDGFGIKESKLLNELASNLSHGLNALRSKKNLEQVEHAIRNERDRFQNILNVIGESVYIVNTDYLIEFQNIVSKVKFGDCVGKTCYESLFGKKTPCNFCLLPKTLAKNCVQHVETDLMDQKFYDIIFSPFKEPDGAKKSVVTLRDITERKFLQSEAIRRSHLASIGELAAGVAHEINNPVTGIISIAEILTDKFDDLGGDRNIPERIVREGEKIGNIVKNLLSFARHDQEERHPVNIGRILDMTLDLIEKQLFKSGIHLTVSLPSDLPDVKARFQELQQVFLNIISNASYALEKKYPEPDNNKVLDISGQEIKIKGTAFLRLTFHDHGIGIPKQFMEKLGTPFFTTKPRGEGTGLGVSICHGIVEQHGGSLKFDSKEAEYTKVIIDLPAHKGFESKGIS